MIAGKANSKCFDGISTFYKARRIGERGAGDGLRVGWFFGIGRCRGGLLRKTPLGAGRPFSIGRCRGGLLRKTPLGAGTIQSEMKPSAYFLFAMEHL